MLITYNGIKKVYVKQIDTYEIQTTAGIIHKTDVLYVLTFDTARKLDYFIVKSIITRTLARLGRNQRYESWRMPYAHSSLGIPRLASGRWCGGCCSLKCEHIFGLYYKWLESQCEQSPWLWESEDVSPLGLYSRSNIENTKY